MTGTLQPPPPAQYTLVWVVLAAVAWVLGLAVWSGWS